MSKVPFELLVFLPIFTAEKQDSSQLQNIPCALQIQLLHVFVDV